MRVKLGGEPAWPTSPQNLETMKQELPRLLNRVLEASRDSLAEITRSAGQHNEALKGRLHRLLMLMRGHYLRGRTTLKTRHLSSSRVMVLRLIRGHRDVDATESRGLTIPGEQYLA